MFDSKDPNERDEPTRRGLRVRIAPNNQTAEEHAQHILLRQQRMNGSPPIIPARDSAVVPACCDECEDQMWAAVGSHHHVCPLCREKQETTRQTFLGQIMDRFTD